MTRESTKMAYASAASFVFLAIIAASCAKASPCVVNSDCPMGLYCASGTCKYDCVVAAKDCDPGLICSIAGKCVLPDGGVPPEGGIPDGGSGDGAANDSSADGFVPDGTAGDGGPLKQRLDLCGSDPECAQGLICRPLYKSGPSRCTPSCTMNSQCMQGTRCMQIGPDTFCAMSDVGKTCNVNNPIACNWGCVSAGMAAYCTIACASGSECPNGYGCASIANKKVCVKAEEYCGGGMTCTSAQCDNSILASGCTLPCSSPSDCPQRGAPLAPWTCSGSCRRPADVLGPLPQGDPAEYACDGNNAIVNLCNDAQHIDFNQFTVPAPPSFSCPTGSSVPGTAGDTCVDTCRFAGSCAYGFACTSLGNISGQRVGLCLPSLGAGEVSGNCVHDGDCAFGYCYMGKCSRDCTSDGLCPTGSTCTAGGGPNVENLPFKRCL